MTDDSKGKIELLTLEQVLELLPKEARPPLRTLRERADRLGIPRRRFNRKRVLTRAEAERLLLAADDERIGSQEHRRGVRTASYWSEEKARRERQKKLEELGLVRTASLYKRARSRSRSST
jgi:hypothetical protein